MVINIVNLVGYVGQKPNVRYFESGKVLCKFPIVVESSAHDGEMLVESVDLELWDKKAEIAARYAPEGRLIGITGSLKFSNLLNKKIGKIRNQPVVLVNQIYLLGSKADSKLSVISSESFLGSQDSSTDLRGLLKHPLKPKTNQNLKALSKSSAQNPYGEHHNEHDEYHDEYECGEDPDQGYNEEHGSYDTSMDYGYLDDMSDTYEHLD